MVQKGELFSGFGAGRDPLHPSVFIASSLWRHSRVEEVLGELSLQLL